jgi:hypothetical protein
MRRAALLLIPFFVIACDREPAAPEIAPEFAAADVEWTEGSIAVDYILYCPCLGEDMRLMGTTDWRLHVVTKPDGTARAHQFYALRDDFQMIGQVSGDVWATVIGNHNSNVFELPIWTGFVTINERWVFRNVTTGVVLDWPFKAHYSYNAAGELTVGFIADPCRFRHD